MHAASIDACSIITRCLSLPKRNDKSVWKMHFSAPSQWHKIRFEYQGIIFNEKKAQNFHKCLWSGWGGQPDRKKKTVLVFDDFPKHVDRFGSLMVQFAQRGMLWMPWHLCLVDAYNRTLSARRQSLLLNRILHLQEQLKYYTINHAKPPSLQPRTQHCKPEF